MNLVDVLKYGNRTTLHAVEGLPPADWTTPGVCGYWSVKEIIDHLASFECFLTEVLEIAGGQRAGIGPYLTEWLSDGQAFNDNQVPARAALPAQESLAGYQANHERNMALAAGLNANESRRAGFLPEYGAEYDLEDFVAYTFYGHKREHSAQIAVFRDQIKR